MNCENGSDDILSKHGTRVFKKNSPNGKITAYLGRRDFFDYLTHVDPIDGVVLIDPDYIRDRKVFVQVLAAFRYGHEDLDMLGLAFRKDLYLSTAQVYPQLKQNAREPTWLQDRLLKKLGPNAYPFFFELSRHTPASVTLQPSNGDNGKPCGIDYELRTYVGDSPDDKPQKRNSVRLAIRKLTYAPDVPGPQPSAEISKEFMMSAGTLKLEATLDKEKYYHDETICINVLVDNNSNKTIKKIKIKVRQIVDINLITMNHYKCVVGACESEEGFPIYPSHTGWCKVYRICPQLTNNRDKRGLALDGKIKNEDTNLASSTIITDEKERESFGIIVEYKVQVKLILGFGTSDVSVELPVILSHRKPPVEINPKPDDVARKSRSNPQPDDIRRSSSMREQPAHSNATAENSSAQTDILCKPEDKRKKCNSADEEDLLSFSFSSDPGTITDDLIFENFARLRLLGADASSSSPVQAFKPNLTNQDTNHN